MRNNPGVLDLYIDGNTVQEAEIGAEELTKILQQVSNTISTSITSLCTEIQIGIGSTVSALENLSTGLVTLVSELQSLVVVLQQGFGREQWEEWLSLGVESISVMVELYSIYQTLLALTGALTMAGQTHSVAWEVVNAVHTVSIALTNALSAAMAFLTSPIGLVVVAITALIAIIVLLVNNWDTVKAAAVSVWETIQSAFGMAAAWFDQNVVQPVAGFFTNMWAGVLQGASAVWAGIQAVFSTVAGFFGKVFSEAWAGVVKVFSAAGNIFVNIKDAIVSVFKSVVNGLIKGINSIVAIPFNGINGALSMVKNIEIFGLQPFSGLKTISIPQIPYLAQGAVLPANKPFLAVVGDQKSGTNIEAPLSVIQEAVAAVMDGQIEAMLSGFEALLEENRQLRAAVESIEVGDTVIGQAAARYDRRRALARGGVA